MASKKSETTTENIFREFYGSKTFIEKSAISSDYGFRSKNNTSNQGYPDFFLEEEDYCIVVEAKATEQNDAISEVQHYLLKNNISKDIIGIAVSGQTKEKIKCDYFLKIADEKKCTHIVKGSTLLTLKNIYNLFWKNRYGESVTTENLIKTLNGLNKTFHEKQKVKDTERSLFFFWFNDCIERQYF